MYIYIISVISNNQSQVGTPIKFKNSRCYKNYQTNFTTGGFHLGE